MNEAENRQALEAERIQQQSNELEQLSQIGIALGEARVAQKIALEQIASRLKVSSSKLQGIERGDIQSFGSPVFAKALLRSYGKAVNMDLSQWQNILKSNTTENRVGEAYVSSYRMEHSRTLPPKQVFETQSYGRWIWILLAIGTTVGLYFAGKSYNENKAKEEARFRQDDSQVQHTNTPPPPTASAVTEQVFNPQATQPTASAVDTNALASTTVPTTQVASMTTPTQSVATPSSPSASSTTAVASSVSSAQMHLTSPVAPNLTQTTAVPTQTTAPTQPETAAQNQGNVFSPPTTVPEPTASIPVATPTLPTAQTNASATVPSTLPVVEFTLVNTSWVEAKEKAGAKRRITGSMYEGGQKITINHDQPYRLKVGKADAITGFKVNGQPFDYTTYVKGNVVQIDVPLITHTPPGQ